MTCTGIKSNFNGKRGNMESIIEKIHQFNKFGMILGLDRMEELLKRLGNPHKDLKVIHVAGTNGKGSVSKFLECALKSCGYRIGLYTSPFLEKFNERIRTDGADISDHDLELYGNKVIEASEKMVKDGFDSPTEFEIVTAVAFLYFKETKVDIAVLEVGLGGIGDSTNVVESPLISIISSISYDHMDRLGNTLSEIAFNKAGIIKRGCPVVSNVSEREAAKVIARTAYEKGSRLYDISGIKTAVFDETPFSQKVSMELYEKDYSDVEISMVGKHQAENLKTALAALEILRKSGKIKVERDKLYHGLKNAVQPGRFEIMEKGNGKNLPMMVIDGAHNEAGAKALKETAEKFFNTKRILLVTGMLADKQVDKILQHFTKITHDIIATEPDNPRKLEAEELMEKLKAFGINAYKAETAEKSVRLAESMMHDYDVVIFAGSLYLIGSVRRILRNVFGKKGQ